MYNTKQEILNKVIRSINSKNYDDITDKAYKLDLSKVYDMVLQTMISSFHWNVNKKRATVTRVVTGNDEASLFYLPSEVVSLRDITNERDINIPYDLVSNGRVIVDFKIDRVILNYSCMIEPSEMHSWYQQAFISRLTYEIAEQYYNKLVDADRLLQISEMKLLEAKRIDAVQDTPTSIKVGSLW